MPVDFILYALLVATIAVNSLALAAFWVTPSLRTTANRLTLNLLFVNIIGCSILASTLVAVATTNTEAAVGQSSVGLNSSSRLQRDTNAARESCTCSFLIYKRVAMDKGSDAVGPPWMDGNLCANPSKKLAVAQRVHKRHWSLDMAAALSSLAVLVVVLDTWYAITDPLRYRSRMSSAKVWIFIVLTWAVGILFGVVSAFRHLDIGIEAWCNRKPSSAQEPHLCRIYLFDALFERVFAYIYFVVIIMTPFGLACGMYWRIFSEARRNAHCAFQGGSSPLLKNAITLRSRPASITYVQDTLSPSMHLPRAEAVGCKTTSRIKTQNNDLLATCSACVDKSAQLQSNQFKIVLQPPQDAKTKESSVQRSPPHCKVESIPNIHISCQKRQLLLSSDESGYAHSHALHVQQHAKVVHIINKRLGSMSTVRLRLANVFKYRREFRAAKISVLVVLLFLVSFIPFGLLVLLQSSYRGIGLGEHAQSTQFAVFLLLLSNMGSPLLFAFRNRHVRKGVKKIFGSGHQSKVFTHRPELSAPNRRDRSVPCI